MDEKPDEIMSHIESQRNKLGQNLSELESRVKRTTDWRAQFDRNPMLMMGVALGGGILLGTVVAGARRSSSASTWSSSDYASSYTTPASDYSSADYSSQGFSASPKDYSSKTSYQSSTPSAFREQRRKSGDTLDTIKAALLSFGTAKLKEFMSEALPGFHQHYEEAEKRPSRQPEAQSSYTGYQTGQQSPARNQPSQPVGPTL